MKNNKSENEKNPEIENNSGINNIKNILIDLSNNIYEDCFFNILIKNKSTFLNIIYTSVNEIITSSYSSYDLNDITTQIKQEINIRYNKDYEIIYKSYDDIINNKDSDYTYLINNFIKHCPKTENIGYHLCIKNKLNKYYEIKINNDIKYIFCPECKYCFLPQCIKMVCIYCNKEYFSRILNNTEEKNIFLANWIKYHCGSMKNQIMKCIQCKNNLYINLSTNELICKNKNCNFITNPLSILWQCAKCGEDFRSEAKVYNSTEIDLLKKVINITLLSKKKAFPKELPCCKKNTENMEFYHNDKCKGILYEGFLFDKKIIVCNKCHALNFKNKFIWNCPLCGIKFHLHRFNLITPFKASKYIINKEHSCSSVVKDKNNKMKIKIKNLKNILASNDNINNNISINNYFEKINYFYNNSTDNKILTEDERFSSRDNKKKKYNKFDSISIDNIDNSISQNKNNSKEKSEDSKKEKKYKTLIDILQKRKNNSEKNKNKSVSDLNVLNEFSFNVHNSINYCERISVDAIKKKKNKDENNLVYHKKLSNYKNSRQNKNNRIDKINRCISEIILDNNKLSKKNEKENLNSISIDSNNNLYINKSCINIKSKTIYFNKKINQKKYIINKKLNLKNIYKHRPLTKISNNIFDNNNIPSLFLTKNKKINIFSSIKIYKKNNHRSSLNKNFKNIINNNTKNNNTINLLTPEIIIKISRNCIIPNFTYEYKYIKLIGEGSYSTIYLVENPKNKKLFALKKILCKSMEEIIKYKNQFELLYSLNHLNIMKIYRIHFKYLDFTTYSIYALMERGISDLFLDIKKRILLKQYYTEKEIINILKQIISALLYMKERGIAHRDIKPQNILIFPGNIYKLSDFIEAKNINIKNNGKENINNINIMTLRGSELYMSPIVYDNYKLRRINILHDVFKSDIFSLGYTILFTMCLNIGVLEDIRELNNMNEIRLIISRYFNVKIYSDKLYKLIIGMIELNENERYNLNMIENQLKKW